MKRTFGSLERHGKRESGLSLLEVVIAVAIMSVATLSATLLLVPVARQSQLRREIQTANVAAKRALEKMQAVPFSEIVTTYPQSYTEPIPALPAGTLSVAYADPAADPLLIQLTLSWDAHAGSIQRTFDTVRTR